MTTLKEKRQLRRHGRRWNYIKMDLRKQTRTCSGFIWLRIPTGSAILWTQ